MDGNQQERDGGPVAQPPSIEEEGGEGGGVVENPNKQTMLSAVIDGLSVTKDEDVGTLQHLKIVKLTCVDVKSLLFCVLLLEFNSTQAIHIVHFSSVLFNDLS